MPKKVPVEFMRAVRGHREKLEKIITAKSVNKMQKLYEEAQGSVLAKLQKLMKGGKGATFSAHQSRMVLVQLKQGQAVVAQKLAKGMGPLSKDAQEESLNGLIEDVTKLHKVFTGSELQLPIEEASVFAEVIEGREASLLKMHASSMQRYGANVVGSVQKELALNLLQGNSPQEAYQDVADMIGGEWWQGERIVRTEMAYAFNSTHADGIAASAEEIPELRMRWEEHCNDAGMPLDNRVGVDSIAMHGQVASPGDDFTMPDDAPFPDARGNTEVPDSLKGLSWPFPPNRPNDRSVLAPWMPDWGVPGWEFKDGGRKWLVK